ncbi:MAG: SDR family oxidoreductase [Deltaproteobacteria bacterium]|nr:SDR family oxidoreductase [Deltaproteobacteria bacterium]MCL4873745.1 SDR family oxidoreductase [bacterium]
MAWDLRGRNALVTGGAKRIGKAIATALAKEGANICIHYSSSESEAKEVKTVLECLGVKSWLLQADFDKNGYEGLIERAAEETGGIDILVNNASIFPQSTLRDMTLEGLSSNIRVNAWAPFVLMRDLARISESAKVVNLLDSRLSGYDWTHAEYILSKHLLAVVTKMAAVEYAPGLAINAVSPGLILPPPGKGMEYIERLKKTVPLKKRGSPEEIAAAAIYLLKSEFLAGEVIYVDGGRHLIEYDRGPHPD